MLLFMCSAGKDCGSASSARFSQLSERRENLILFLKLNIEICHNLLLFQRLVLTELASFRI